MPAFFADPAFWIYGSLAMACYGLSKGGFVGLAVLGLPIFAVALPPLTAAAIMLPVLLAQDLVTVWAYRKSFDKRSLIVLLIGSLIGTAIGAATVSWMSEAVLKLSVGVIALAFALNWWVRRWLKEPEAAPFRRSDGAGVFWGAWCGLTSFIAHAGAPPLQVYLMPLKLAPAVLSGTMAILFLILNIVKLAPYTQLGLFSRETLIAAAALMPAAIAANLIGIGLVKRISVARFYPLIYALLALVGLKLSHDGVIGLL